MVDLINSIENTILGTDEKNTLTQEDIYTDSSGDDSGSTNSSLDKTLEDEKKKKYQEQISSDRDGFVLHQGEILETHTYDKIYSTNWNYDYEGIGSDGNITLPFHKEDLDYIYKGVRCLLKTKRFDNFDDKIEIDDSEGYLCFITDVNISDNKLDLSLCGYEKLLEQENILSFTNQRRSTILEEVIKMAGLVPIIDTTGLADDIISWSTEKNKDSSDSNGGNSGDFNVNGDGSLTEEQVWEIAKTFHYAGIGTNHDPQKAWDMIGTKTGASGDCYDITAWFYYVFNMKVGIPARDICYHSDYASSGSHHTIQLFKNGQWEDPSGYDDMTTNLKVIKSRDKTKDHVSREPPNNGNIPPYVKCPHSNNG